MGCTISVELGWPGLERSEAPEGDKTRIRRARLRTCSLPETLAGASRWSSPGHPRPTFSDGRPGKANLLANIPIVTYRPAIGVAFEAFVVGDQVIDGFAKANGGSAVKYRGVEISGDEPLVDLLAVLVIGNQPAHEPDVLVVVCRCQVAQPRHPQHLRADPAVPSVAFPRHRRNPQKQAVGNRIATAEMK